MMRTKCIKEKTKTNEMEVVDMTLIGFVPNKVEVTGDNVPTRALQRFHRRCNDRWCKQHNLSLTERNHSESTSKCEEGGGGGTVRCCGTAME